jgi:FtsH-binding integral membrane protein
MSSKKARRRERQEQTQDGRRSRFTPATLFLLSIGLVIALVVAATVVLGDRSDRGEPPWAGAVWSAAHGHWH